MRCFCAPRSRTGRWFGALFVAGAAALVASCNAALGGGVVAVLGGAGFLAGQCYDRVLVRVRDPRTGQLTCDANVWVSDEGGSERRLRPCYNAALTEGTWTVTARRDGYRPASTELTIPARDGDCPHYTHSIELTLRRTGEPSTPPTSTRSASAGSGASSATPAAAGPLGTPPARVVPPPIPHASGTVPARGDAPTPPAPTPPAVPEAPPSPPVDSDAPR